LLDDELADFPAGELIFSEGDSGDCAYLVEHGRVSISIGRGPEKRLIATRGPGEIFGEMAIIDGSPRSANATALEATRLRRVTRERLSRRVEKADPVLRMVLDVLLVRLRAALSDIDRNGSPSAQVSASEPPMAHHLPGIDEIRLEHDLARAISAGTLVLYYQPIIDLSTRRLDGFEALVRWQHPERGWLSPLSFIPLAEESGLIRGLTQWALAQAAEAASTFEAAMPPGAHRPPFVAVNVSGHDLLDPEFSDFLAKTVGPDRLARGQIKIEVTESVFVRNPDAARACLDQCRALGAGIAIDDFGTGYSNLSYLHSLPITALKIDRSFVMNLAADEGSRKIVRTILRLADDLDIQTVGEGIEDLQSAKDLAAMGCMFGQGYYFARPMPLADARQWLVDWDHERPWTGDTA